MQAVWVKEFGGPRVLVPAETAEPRPGEHDVVIRVEFANVTFVETQVRAGTGPFAVELPMIPGNGVGGVVSAVGGGVDRGLVGRRVVTSTGGSGGYAEAVAVDTAAPYDVPPGMRLDEAVALLADGRTAMMLVDAAGIRSGDRVLVEAAAGGVGTLLVQLVRAAGGHVVAAAGGADKTALASELGADTVVDYRQQDWAEVVRAAIGGVDVVLDGVGGELARVAFGLLDHDGRMLSFGLASGRRADISAAEAAERGVALVSTSPTPEQLRTYTRQALRAGADGRLRPVIGQRFALERAADAHAAIESRSTIGKTLLEIT